MTPIGSPGANGANPSAAKSEQTAWPALSIAVAVASSKSITFPRASDEHGNGRYALRREFWGEVGMMKLGTEKLVCAAAVVGACALIVLATHHTAADEPAATAETQMAPAVASAAASESAPIRATPSSPAIDPSRAGKLLYQLQTLRSQLELWKLQHEDRVPDLRRFDQWQQLTQRTSIKGEPKDAKDAKGGFG